MHKHRLSVLLTHLEKNKADKSILDKIAQQCHFNYVNFEQFKQQFLAVKTTYEQEITRIFVLLQLDEEQYLKEHSPYITKDQMQEMMDHGFYFGGHTMSHRPLNELSFEEQKREITASVHWLKANFDVPYSLFAFPFSDRGISKQLIQELFVADPSLLLFGNSGIKIDIDSRIIQRFSIENPTKDTETVIIMENLYKIYNKTVGKYNIKRD